MSDLGQRIESWNDLLFLRDRRVHVVGAGSVEGAHLLLFFLDHGFTRLVGHDFAEAEQFARAFNRVHVGWPREQRQRMLDRLRAGVDLRYRDRYLEGIEEADAIAVTQGWYLYPSNERLLGSPSLQERFFSLMQLYLSLAPGRVVGVTGSQGKSTTTRLLRDMLVADGRDVIFAGNDRHGRQALGLLETAASESMLLLEISNRHLKTLERSPDVAVVTNIYPNHLDEHGGWDGYVEAKSRLIKYQRQGDIAVLNADIDVTRRFAELTPAEVLWFGEGLPEGGRGVVVEDERLVGRGLDSLVLGTDDIPLPGRHNAFNVAAAATTALALGVSPSAISRAVAGFHGLRHRLQFVWDSGGVRFYDDLNSTTPTATEAALRSLNGDVVWIFGGDDKGLDSESLAEIAARAVRLSLALPGKGTDALVTNLRGRSVAVEVVPDLPTAVARAVEVARPGNSVLLSPACPGFFARYYVGVDEDTGFRKLVREATLSRSATMTPAAEATSPPARRPQT
ncbi:MAG TPA: UDP-N-acetylmuramoyl-L-alanine--D-glutamate ligase [Candidatus Dormibacteraeota bacterium]|nr:UDP-N-acetylmuramoyl-L-alanine--D-glutamate ligase [Candidatus Dormibacteraeota bacterium]